VGVIIAADRLNPQAANAFLKTLEEPPDKTVIILLSTEPQRLLETILSRCLRLNICGGKSPLEATHLEWLERFSEVAAAEQKSLLGRYRLLDVLVNKLNALKEGIGKSLTAESPLERYVDVEEELREKWEKELAAGIEAEYRLQRSDLLAGVQLWLRDVWLQTLAVGGRTVESASIDGHQATSPPHFTEAGHDEPSVARAGTAITQHQRTGSTGTRSLLVKTPALRPASRTETRQ